MRKGICNLLPDHRASALTAIDPEILQRYALAVFDVDNTLVFPETVESPSAIVEWFHAVASAQKCVCVSNSRTWETRRVKVAALLGCETFAGSARKPRKRLFSEILQRFNVTASQVVVIGDRLISDVFFGNHNGAATILVPPLTRTESVWVRLARLLERGIARLFVLVCRFRGNG